MFDLRYHVASLAAVFLMLVVGILIGVGISGRGFVDDAERDRLNDRIAGLQEEVDAANATADDLERRQQAAQDFVTSAYPVLVENRLAGKNIAVAVLGSLEQDSFAFVETRDQGRRRRPARADARGRRCRCASRRSKPTLADRPELGGYVGRRAARQPRPRSRPRARHRRRDAALGRARAARSSRSSRATSRVPVDGVVVIRSAEPQAGPAARASWPASTRGSAAPACRPSASSRPGSSRARSRSSSATASRRSTGSTPSSASSRSCSCSAARIRANYGVRDTADDGILPPIEPLPAPSG